MKTKEPESQARANLKKLRKVAGMKDVASSLERLLDGASKGGDMRAKRLPSQRRKEIASKAAKARWGKKVKK